MVMRIAGEEKICSNCGFKGDEKWVTRGSIFIEIILWLAFLLPGVIYSIWRLSSKFTACPKCGTKNMVPLNSPRGEKLLEDYGLTPKDMTYNAYANT